MNEIKENIKQLVDRNNNKVFLHTLYQILYYASEEQGNVTKEYFLLRLYNKLKPLIPEIDSLMTSHCDRLDYTSTFKKGGNHGLLFYLKSLDLDLRCKYPLGTVCGYHRVNFNNK